MENEEISHLIQNFFIYFGSWMRCQLKNQRDQDYPLSVSQFKVMLMLKNLKICSMSALSKEMEVSKGTMTTTLNKLVEEGLVQRSTSFRDRRTVFVELTCAGQEQVKKLEKGLEKSFMEILASQDEASKRDVFTGLKVLNCLFHDTKKKSCE